MRTGTKAVTRSSIAVITSLLMIACTTPPPTTLSTAMGPIGPLTGPEDQRFVDLPDNSNTLNPGQRARYQQARRMHPSVRQRCNLGAYTPATPGVPSSCTQSVPVKITAVEGAKFVRFSALPPKPQILAWIENLGAYPTFDNLRPRTQAVYALVVDTAQTAGPPGLVLVEFDLQSNAVTRRPYGRVLECHSYGQPFQSGADFQPCNHTYPQIIMTPVWKAEIRVTSLMTIARNFYNVDDPVWFTCASGCCTSA